MGKKKTKKKFEEENLLEESFLEDRLGRAHQHLSSATASLHIALLSLGVASW